MPQQTQKMSGVHPTQDDAKNRGDKELNSELDDQDKIVMLMRRVEELERDLEREAAGREIELTMQEEEFASADENHRQTIDSLRFELNEAQQSDAERQIMEEEVELLRKRVIDANEEVSTLTHQSEEEVARIRRKQFHVTIQLEEQFRENIEGLRSKLREEVTGSLQKSSKEALDTNERLRTELAHQSEIVFELLAKFKEVEEEKKKMRLCTSLANKERDVCAMHNVKLQQQLRKQQALLQNALPQVDLLPRKYSGEDCEPEPSPEVRVKGESKGRKARTPTVGARRSTRKQRDRRIEQIVHEKKGDVSLSSRNTRTPSLPPVKQASITVESKNGTNANNASNTPASVLLYSSSAHDWLKAADKVIRGQYYSKGGLLGTLGLQAPVTVNIMLPIRTNTDSDPSNVLLLNNVSKKNESTSAIANSRHPIHNADSAMSAPEPEQQNDEIWRATDSHQRATRMPILTSNNVCD